MCNAEIIIAYQYKNPFSGTYAGQSIFHFNWLLSFVGSHAAREELYDTKTVD